MARKRSASQQTLAQAAPTLSERRERVLRIVIQEYARTVQPVSSKSIVEQHDLGVSAATVRNDLAALEKAGLLTHPHTSAGRVPTDAGYRYYVQNLLMEDRLSAGEQREIRTSFDLARQNLDQWLRVSTTLLANVTHGAALATAPRATTSHFKHLELVAIQGTRVLMVLVLQTGTVKQQLLDFDEPLAQSELSRASNELNDLVLGCDSSAIRATLPTLSPFAQQVAILVADTMDRADSYSRTIYRDGLSRMLELPEFTSSNGLRSIVQVMEERSLLEQVMEEYSPGSDVQVIIAGDGRYAELQEISLVLGRYGDIERATGVLGVLGPLRMSYGRTIGAVRYVAALMSDMVDEMDGQRTIEEKSE